MFDSAHGRANRAHDVEDATRPEARLHNLESAAFHEQDTVKRHTHVSRATDCTTARAIWRRSMSLLAA
jgi:hypothetical protein